MPALCLAPLPPLLLVQYCNLDQRGFVLMHVTRAKCHAEFHFVSSVKGKEYKNYCGAGGWATGWVTDQLA